MVLQGGRYLTENGRRDVLGQTGAAVLRNRTLCWVIGVSAGVQEGLGHTICGSSQPSDSSLLNDLALDRGCERRDPCGALGS